MISVLYVDDEQDLAEIARLFLEESGEFKVETAGSAKDALASPFLPLYDAVVSDYQMPGMDGISFLKTVRERFGNIPFILFTGKGREEVVIAAINNGADFYLQKGGDPEAQFAELAHKIRQAVTRRWAEVALKDSEKRLADIISFLPDATFAIDRDGRVIAWNRAIEEMTGVPAADIQGKGDREYAIPFYGTRRPILIDLIFEPDNVIRERYTHIVHEKDTLMAETTLPRPLGKAVVLSGKASPLYNRQGEIVGAIESIRDITEQKRAGEELAFKNAILSTQQETSLDAILTVDAGGRIINYNQKFVELWGIPKNLFVSGDDEPVLQYVRDQLADPEAFLARVRYLYEHRDEKSFEEILLKDGRVLERFSAAMFGDQGRYYGRVWYFRDISGRKRAEALLLESQDRFRRLYVNMIEGAALHTLIYDKRGVPVDYLIVETNPAFGKHLGIPGEQVTGKTSRVAYGVADPPYLEIYSRVALTGKPEVFETFFPPMDKYFSISVYSPAKGMFATIFEDISERKRAEKSLRESEEKYRELSELLPQAVFELAPDFRITYANRHAQDTLGFTVKDIDAGISAFNFVEPSHHARVRENARQLEEGSPTVSQEYSALRRDGTPFPALIYTSAIFRGGVFSGYRGVIVDISSRKRMEEELLQKNRDLQASFEQLTAAEEELRQNYDEIYRQGQVLQESEEKFRRLMENAPDMIYRMSLPDGKYEFISPASVAITGYSPEEFYTNPGLIRSLIAPRWREYFRTQWEALLAGKTPPVYEYEIIDRAGTSRWINQRNMLVANKNGEPVAIEGIVTDITRQKKTEHELQKSEHRFLAVTENAGSWIWEIDTEGIYRYSSPAVEQILGYQPEELVRKMHFFDLFDPEVRDSLREVTLAAFSRREPFRNFVNANRHRDGRLVILSTSGTPVFDENGEFAGYCGVDEDITRDVTAEGALRESEEKFRSFVETSPNIIWEIGPVGDLRYISPMIEPILGYKPEDVIGRTLFELVREEDIPDVRNRLAAAAIPGAGIPPLEVPVRHRDGHTILLEIRPGQMETADKKVTGFRGIAVDITERKRADDALRKSRQQLAEAMDIARLADWECDIINGIFLFNDRFYALYGTTAEREGGYQMPVETYAREFVHPDDRHLVVREVRKASGTRDPQYMSQTEHRIIRRDGAVRDIVVRVGVTMDEGGRVIRTYGANQDITERKKAEEALSRANRQLSLLSGVTRHDILNKISVIRGFLTIARKKNSDPVLADLMKKIESNVLVIQSQIEFTRMYQNLGSKEPQWIDLEPLMPRSHTPSEVTLITYLQGVEVYADPMLERVFFNLLDNAIRHGERVTEIRVSAHKSGTDLIIAWEDNGVGIAADEKARIFERGFGKNTGFGLFLVREILALTGITIAETGIPGRGARFEILVPEGTYRTGDGYRDIRGAPGPAGRNS